MSISTFYRHSIAALASVSTAILLAACGGGSGNNTAAGDSAATASGTSTMLATTTTSTTWTHCADENGTCSFSGTKTVRYGANGTYVTKSLTGPVACNNNTFGDPLVGTPKGCDYATTTTTTAPTTTTTWTHCADENGTCSYSGTKTIRYGANGTYVTKSLAGPVACNNNTFGDPLVGTPKGCDYATTTTTTAPTTTTTWTYCADENGTCSYSGTKNVRYGANGTYVTKTLTGPVACNNTTFGDPAVGVTKACDYSDTTTTSTGATSGSTTTTTATWTHCADENGTCSYSGTKNVRYGANGTYVTKTLTGPVACNNTTFGDPAVGVTKACDYSDTTTTSTGATSGSTTTTSPSTSTAASGPYGQDASLYTLSFSEEFNSYDTSRWNDHIWYEGSNATQNYTVENGSLKIWPQRDGSGNFFNRTIDTDGKYYQTYGYFEMEAKLPNGKGTWPAFWLLNHDAADPYRPEIDILEAYAGGGPNTGWSDSNLHPTTYASTVWPNGINGGPTAGSKAFQNLGDLSAGFHKYGLKWEPNKITFYFDGQEMYSVNSSMSNRMYILLDLWFGSASGNPDDSTPTGKSNSYEVNYVRAWQFK